MLRKTSRQGLVYIHQTAWIWPDLTQEAKPAQREPPRGQGSELLLSGALYSNPVNLKRKKPTAESAEKMGERGLTQTPTKLENKEERVGRTRNKEMVDRIRLSD